MLSDSTFCMFLLFFFFFFCPVFRNCSCSAYITLISGHWVTPHVPTEQHGVCGAQKCHLVKSVCIQFTDIKSRESGNNTRSVSLCAMQLYKQKSCHFERLGEVRIHTRKLLRARYVRARIRLLAREMSEKQLPSKAYRGTCRQSFPHPRHRRVEFKTVLGGGKRERANLESR